MKKIIQFLKNKYHLRQALKAEKRYKKPHKELKIIGVTGTDGKTSTIALIVHILKRSGFRVGYISTTNADLGLGSEDTGLHVTSPDPWKVPEYLRKMVDNKVEFAVLETTSQGLVQNRFGSIKFDAAVITNIRNDHLDYHGTWENYAKAKFGLLKKLKDDGVAILNSDDIKSAKWIRDHSHQIKQKIYVKWASKQNIADYKPEFDKINFKYSGLKFSVPVMGALHNLENLIQAIMLTETIVPIEQIKKSLNDFTLPSGRLELMIAQPLRVIVDFAHTPASLETALMSVRKVLPKGKRLITVFGCAGKRDKGRRDMGLVSAQHSDVTILTAEDPRSESVSEINSEIINRAKPYKPKIISRFTNHEDYSLTSLGEIHANIETAWKQSQTPFITFDENTKQSRVDAIEMALRIARRGDCVFVTGKGHEKSLAFGKQEKEYSWSDQDEVRRVLKKLKITS